MSNGIGTIANLCHPESEEDEIIVSPQDMDNVQKFTSIVDKSKTKDKFAKKYQFNSLVSFDTMLTLNKDMKHPYDIKSTYLAADDTMMKAKDVASYKALTGCVTFYKDSKPIHYQLYDVDVNFVKLNYNLEQYELAYPVVKLSNKYDSVVFYLYDRDSKKIIVKSSGNIKEALTSKVSTETSQSESNESVDSMSLGIIAGFITAFIILGAIKSFKA